MYSFINLRNYFLFFLFAKSFFSAHALEPIFSSDLWNIQGGVEAQGAFQQSDTKIQLLNNPKQKLNNQPTSVLAHMPPTISLLGNVEHKNWGKFKLRILKFWEQPFSYGVDKQVLSTHQINIQDFYAEVPWDTQNAQLWFGVRSFEFEGSSLFGIGNPFDQIAVQGGGIEWENIRFAAGLRTQTVSSIGANSENKLVSYKNSQPQKYEATEYVAKIFISAKLLLSEGRLFEPIFSLNYYTGIAGKNKDNVNIYSVKPASAMIVGGVFSRPLANYVSGTTTLWFSSLPAEKTISPSQFPQDNTYEGAGRVDAQTPKNTIGLLDNSSFYFKNYIGLLSAIALTYESYPSELPILNVVNQGNALQPDENKKTNVQQKMSLTLEPQFFIAKKVSVGANINGTYVSQKLFYDDANALLISPFCRWIPNNLLLSPNYIFLSVSYGKYDWKLKQLSNGSMTDTLWTAQLGGHFNL